MVVDPIAVDQATALDLLAVNLQIFDRTAADIFKQRLAVISIVQLVATAVQDAAEVAALVAVCADGDPVGGQGDIVGHLEVDVGEGDVRLVRLLLDRDKIIAALEQVRVAFRAVALEAVVRLCVGQLNKVADGGGALGRVGLGGGGHGEEHIVLALGQADLRQEALILADVAAFDAALNRAGDLFRAFDRGRRVIVAFDLIRRAARLGDIDITVAAVFRRAVLALAAYREPHFIKRGAGGVLRPVNAQALLICRQAGLDGDDGGIDIGQLRGDQARVGVGRGDGAGGVRRGDAAEEILLAGLGLRGGLIRRRRGALDGSALASGSITLAPGAEPLIAEGQAVLRRLGLDGEGHLRILGDAGLGDGLLGDGGGILRRQGPGEVQGVGVFQLLATLALVNELQGDIGDALGVPIVRQIHFHILQAGGIGLRVLAQVELDAVFRLEVGRQLHGIRGDQAADLRGGWKRRRSSCPA